MLGAVNIGRAVQVGNAAPWRGLLDVSLQATALALDADGAVLTAPDAEAAVQLLALCSLQAGKYPLSAPWVRLSDVCS